MAEISMYCWKNRPGQKRLAQCLQKRLVELENDESEDKPPAFSQACK
jgi:hypothetical protein